MVVKIAIALGLVAAATLSSPLGARELPGLSGTAMQVVRGLSEPGAMVVWGSVLAGLSIFLNRERH